MILRVESFGHAAVDSLADGSFQLRQTAFVLLQKPQAGPNNLAGIVITPLCDFCLDEILEITPRATDVVFIVVQSLRKITNI